MCREYLRFLKLVQNYTALYMKCLRTLVIISGYIPSRMRKVSDEICMENKRETWCQNLVI